MKRRRTEFFFKTALIFVAIGIFSLPVNGFAQDYYLIESHQMACGNPRIWDISGSYTDNLETLNISQDTKGKITGHGDDFTSSYTDKWWANVFIYYDIKGMIKQKNGVAAVKIDMKEDCDVHYLRDGDIKKIKGRHQILAEINPVSNALVGTRKVTLFGSTGINTFYRDLPSGMDGSWTLEMSIIDKGKKMLGEGLLRLSNGRALSFAVRAMQNTKTNEIKFNLKGISPSATGCKLSLVIDQQSGHVTSVKGNVLGQTIDCNY